MVETTLSRRALNRATLARQMLLRREKATPVAALERIAGMQAQLARPPFIGLWSRVEGFDRKDLVRAVERKEVVRGTLMRATLHLVSRDEFVAHRPALQSMLSQAMQGVLRDRRSGLDADVVVSAARAYFDQKPATFDALRTHLAKLYPRLDVRAMGYIVRTHLPLLQIPAGGAKWAYPATADFAVAESWLGKRLGSDPGPGALLLRYLAAFGPATLRDFQTWSGVAIAADVVQKLRPTLRTFRDERGRELLDVPKAPLPDEKVAAPVRFLPEFDSVLLAFADRSRIIADEHRPAIATRNLLVPATFLVDGFVAGTWKIERKAKTATLAVKPFGTLPRPVRRHLEEEGEKLLRFAEDDAQAFAVR
jgi:Winged helix DNA-binding domain